MMPADSLVYIESNDLGSVMKTITDRPAFREVAKSVPDFSALNGVKLAVSVTGFETKELPISESGSELRFTPHFVAAIDTNAWNFQANSFTENQLGEFINHVYGGEVLLETSNKNHGSYYVWSSNDGRKAFALVQGSVVLFSNDESSIDKCLAVKRGEVESIAKNPKITDGERLAFGYVSRNGVAQIANIAGLTLAKNSSEESAVQSFVAEVLPTVLRNSLTDATWTANSDELGIQDKYSIGLDPSVGNILSETIIRAGGVHSNSRYLPANLSSVTHYQLNDPQLAWRSVVLTVQKQTDAVSGRLLAAFSSSLFENYGIEEPEQFLRSIGQEFFTARLDPEGENTVVIVEVKDLVTLKASLAKEISFSKPPEKIGIAEVWRSADGELAAAFADDTLVLGDSPGVIACLDANVNYEKMPGYPLQFSNDKNVTVTFSRDMEIAGKLDELISDRKEGHSTQPAISLTETQISKNAIERRTVSDFGLIGRLITQFTKDEE